MSAPSGKSAARAALVGMVVKELRQVRADPRILQVLLLAPLLQLFLFSYAANLDTATARVAIVDHDRSPASRSLAARIGVTEGFEVLGEVHSEAEGYRLLGAGDAELIVAIPQGYGRALAGGEPIDVQNRKDGADSVSASIGVAGLGGLVGRLSSSPAQTPGAEARPRVLFNPELRSRLFMVPGVLAMVLLVVTMIATSMAIVRERELGTLEQLVVTPISRSTLLAGKLLPYALFGLVDAALVLLLARFWFGVPFEGSPLLLWANVPFFLLASLGLGLLASTVSGTQQQAMLTSVFFMMIPMIYLSGFVFPVESMPRVVQPLTELNPLRHFLTLLRGIMLKGAGFAEVWPTMVKLAAIGAGIFALSVTLFHKRTG